MLQDKSSAEPSSADWDLKPSDVKKMVPAEKRALAVKMKQAGVPVPEIAAKLKVSQQRVHQYQYEAAGKKRKAGKIVKKAVKHGGGVHRLAQKVRRQAIELLQTQDSDFLVDILLLTGEILRIDE